MRLRSDYGLDTGHHGHMATTQQGSTAKAAMREQLRDHPVLWPPTSGIQLTEHVISLAPEPQVASCYISYGDEAPTISLRTAWIQAGARVLIPILMPNKDLDWVLDDGTAGHAKQYSEPSGQHLGIQAVAAAEVIIVPVLAVGEDGARLGQGGGSYDRVLGRLPREGRLVIALAHDDRVFPAGILPVERHDVPVDVIVTPHRIIRTTTH